MAKLDSEKRILIIGNGFDIAHGLPTQYVDFMDFIDDEKYTGSKAYQKVVDKTGDLCKEYLEKVREMVLSILGEDNQILKFIGSQLDTQRDIGENWVDFEREIANVVKHAEEKFYKKSEAEIDIPRANAFEMDFSNIPSDEKKLHEDFYRLNCAFEYYVAELVDKIDIDCYSKDIQNLKPDLVISLNYSDTYERLYSKFCEIDYVHGKAEISNAHHSRPAAFNLPLGVSEDKNVEFYRDHNHIVLGMDEYYSEDEIRTHTHFIQFRKYFQRIVKRTGSKYRKLLDAEKLKIYVFGHSLDPTDAELLRETIGRDTAETTIFYHDESAHIRGISNLIRIFGQKEVIEKCDGKDPRITFVKQDKMESTCDGGHFHLMNGLEYLRHFKDISGVEFEKNYSRVAVGINSGRGIETQNDILSAYVTLYRLGLGEEFKTKLIEIVGDKPARDSSGDLVSAIWLDPEWWAEPTVDQKLEVPREIRDFIHAINEINSKKLNREGKRLICDNNAYIHPFEKEIPSEITQDDYGLFLIQMILALRNTDNPKRIWRLLESVTVANGNVGAQVELTGLAADKDEYMKTVANVLLDYLNTWEEESRYYEYMRSQMTDQDDAVDDFMGP